jgi:uncharacterized protein YijF (DUF1287 family)
MKPTLFAIIFLLVNNLQLISQSRFYESFADSTVTLTKQYVRYDPTYFKLEYPNGDVPADRGVCTDVVIRAYRKMGID